MTTPLIEAIARALCVNDDRNPDDPFFANSPDGLRQWKGYEFDAMTALTAITEAGYAVVPVEPSPEMLKGMCQAIEQAEMTSPDPDDAGYFWGCSWINEAKDAHRAMIQASQGGGA